MKGLWEMYWQQGLCSLLNSLSRCLTVSLMAFIIPKQHTSIDFVFTQQSHSYCICLGSARLIFKIFEERERWQKFLLSMISWLLFLYCESELQSLPWLFAVESQFFVSDFTNLKTTESSKLYHIAKLIRKLWYNSLFWSQFGGYTVLNFTRSIILLIVKNNKYWQLHHLVSSFSNKGWHARKFMDWTMTVSDFSWIQAEEDDQVWASCR